MWLLLYVTKDGKEVETLLAAINKGDYSLCEDTVRSSIIEKLRAASPTPTPRLHPHPHPHPQDQLQSRIPDGSPRKSKKVKFQTTLPHSSTERRRDTHPEHSEEPESGIKYLELENSKEEEKAKENFAITSLPALLFLDREKKEVIQVYYKEDIFLGEFTIPDF